jgi:hypothetical protein
MDPSGHTLEDLVARIVRAAVRDEIRPLQEAIDSLRRHQQPAFVDVKRAGELTGLSVATLRRRVRDGGIGSKKVGGRVLIDVDSLKVVDAAEVAQLAAKVAG